MPLENALILTCEECNTTLIFTGEVAEEMTDRGLVDELAGTGWLYVPDEFYSLDGKCYCPEHQPEKVANAG